MRPSTIGRLAAAGFAAAAVTVAGITAAAAPAAATGEHNVCQVVTHGVTTDITLVPAATVELVENGVKISTPDTPAKANWKSGAVDVKLTDLTDAEYSTFKHDSAAPAALPAFHLYLKTTDGKLATIVYEPYYQDGVGNPAKDTWKTWDVLAGKWWTSSSNLTGVTAEGGGSYAGNKTLAYIASKNPGVTVIAYGWGQGTYNAGTVATLRDLKFATKKTCVQHKWSAKYKPSPSPSTSKSVSPSPSASSSKSPAAPVSPSVSPTASLPVTGVSTPGLVAAGVGLVAGGAGVLLLLRRRRRSEVKFTA